MQETWVQSLSCEDPLEKGMATHSSNLENSMTEESHGVAKSQIQLSDSLTYTHRHYPEELPCFPGKPQIR